MRWSRLVLALGLAAAMAVPALAQTPEPANAALATDIAQLMFQGVDWRARMLSSMDVDAQAARSGISPAWTPLLKQALLDEADHGRDDIDGAVGRYFARYFTPDELAAGDALMRGDAGRYITQIYSDPTHKPATTDSVRRAFSQALATPAGSGFLHKLDALGRHPAALDDVTRPAFALGFVERFGDQIEQSDAGRAAAAQPQTELQRHLLEAISILFRDVDYSGLVAHDFDAAGVATMPGRPDWPGLMKQSAIDAAAADHHEVDRILAMALSSSFTQDEVDAALVVLRTPEGAAISREVADSASGHPSQNQSHDAVVAMQRLAQTPAGRQFMDKISQFGRLAGEASPQVVAFEAPRILHRFVEQARAQEASRPLPSMTDAPAAGS
jgi:hypothetical protein